MVNKFFKEFSGDKAAFKNGGYETTLANNIVFIMDESNNGAGACIFTRGMYFADMQSLIASLAFVKGINVGGTNYNAAQGGGYVKFEAADPATVVYVESNGVKIGLSEDFVSAHNQVISDVAAIKADYLKASDKQELQKSINDKDAAMKQYVDAEIAKVASSESFTAIEGRVSTLEGKVKAIEDDHLVGQDRTDLEGLIEAAEGRLGQRITTEAPVTMETSNGEGEILHVYTFKQNGQTIGTINTRKELVVTGGEIVEKEGVKYLQLSIANQETPVEIPVSELVDVYTAGDYVTIGADNKISVDKAGIIEGLATDANAQKYASDAKAGAISDAEGKIASAIAGEVSRADAAYDKKGDGAAAASAVEGRVNEKIGEIEESIEGINGAIATKAEQSFVTEELGKKANSADVYTKTAADQLLGGKANVGDSYTKGEADALLGNKANKSEVYTKGQADSAIATALEPYAKTADVEGLVSPKADKSYVDTELAKKANSGDSYLKSETYNKEEVNGLVSPKADKSYVDTELGKKANSGDSYLKSETYTQAEVQAMFDSAFAWERIEA